MNHRSSNTIADQFRMHRLQAYNWGTFSGLHDIPIADKGFLFVGPSGAGKSTLLDIFIALLVPPRWADFNAAARESGKRTQDRNLANYIRGAWGERTDSNSKDVTLQHLRKGTTWSALALTYQNTNGQTVVLVRLFWIRGNSSGSADIKHQYLIFNRPFDLRDIKDFDLDIRKLKRSLPDAFVRDDFSSYCERFRSLLGIQSETALRLLLKAQSAKNLDDLNGFLREFMLDKPKTFDAAEQLVSEFAELNSAHQAVVTAREQIHILEPARKDHTQCTGMRANLVGLEHLSLGSDGYREKMRASLLAERATHLETDKLGLSGELVRATELLNTEKSHLSKLQLERLQVGGELLQHLQEEDSSLRTQLTEKLRKLGQAQAACTGLGWDFPSSPVAFANLVAQAHQETDSWPDVTRDAQQERSKLERQKEGVESEFASAANEVRSLKSQSSNIPADMLQLRYEIASALGLNETALPFVGELLEVRPEESSWQGSIERVLRGFALSLLVEERHYNALSSHVNAVHLGKRLFYYRTSHQEPASTKPLSINSLVHKVTVKDGQFSQWLKSELRRRYDYACAESLSAFRNAEWAITREGLARHGKSRHEKNDQRNVGDRKHWVLGFDNREKRQLYEQQAIELAKQIENLNTKLVELEKRNTQQTKRIMHCQILVNLEWQEIDAGTISERIAAVESQIKEARKENKALQEIDRRIEGQTKIYEKAETKLGDLKAELKSIESKIADVQKRLSSFDENPLISALSPTQLAGLEERYSKSLKVATLENIEEIARSVERGLVDESRQLTAQIGKLEKDIEGQFQEFKRRWPMEASDLDGSMASAPDFFAKLQRLEIDGLPRYEDRFLELLRNQSHQNLAALSTHLTQARKEISDRLEEVNSSLRHAEFNSGTYLVIEVDDRHLPEVREFRQQIQEALSNAWSDDKETAETRFVVLRGLVERFKSQETEHRTWKDTVLDVRQHVEFIGRELNSEGLEMEVYRGGAGKSGGQRQKLATTCLAAALRYQLGSEEHSAPVYAPVVLDEAFDKADPKFTELAMNIFDNFGFQMIVATPLRAVMTLEPFIGGACFVDIQDRKKSGILLIEYDLEKKRLKLPEHAREAEIAPVS